MHPSTRLEEAAKQIRIARLDVDDANRDEILREAQRNVANVAAQLEEAIAR